MIKKIMKIILKLTHYEKDQKIFGGKNDNTERNDIS